MKKHFLLLLLMTLLPLAGWAADVYYDVQVKPFDTSVTWFGDNIDNFTVTRSMIIVSGEGKVSNPNVKDGIANLLKIKPLDNYNVGEHTYSLQLKDPSNNTYHINDGGDDVYYNVYVLSGVDNSATLTINKWTGNPNINTSNLKYVTQDLFWNNDDQHLLDNGATATTTIFDVEVPVIYTLDPNANKVDTFFNYADVKAKAAAEYHVYYKVAGTDNYAGSTEWADLGLKTINKLNQNFNDNAAKPTANTWTFDNQSHPLAIAPTAPAYGKYMYATSLDAAEWTNIIPNGKSNSENKTVYWKVVPEEGQENNYTGMDASENAKVEATINKASRTITAAPVAAADLKFNREDQQLITTAAQADGAVSYLVREAEIEGTTEEVKIQNLNDAFAQQSITDIAALVGKGAKTYYVYYKVAADDDHNEKVVTTPIEVTIARKSLESNDITAEMLPEFLNQTYRGSAIVPEISKFVVKDGENELVFGLDKDFIKENQNNINVPADNATDEQKPRIKITGRGNYEGVKYIYFNIVPRNIVGAEIATEDLNAERVFTGQAIKPAVTSVSFATPSIALTAGTDYDVVYTDSINAGEATITINAKGNFTGTKVLNYTITPAQIGAIDVTVTSPAPYYYTGKEIKLEGTAKLITDVDPNNPIEYTLTENDYELTFENNVNVGTATAIISAKGGNFTGEPKQINFPITRRPLTVKVANATKSFGQVDPTPEIESIDGFAEGEDKSYLPENAYTITRVNNTEEIGHYAWNVVTNNEVACNYAFENANPQGELTITGATVFIRPQDATKTYGYVLPELNKEAFGFTADGLSNNYNITSLTFTVTDNSDPEHPVVKNAGDRLDVGTYTITASAAQTDASQYVFDYSTTATLTIEQKEIILQAQPQEVAFGGEPVLDSEANTYIKVLEADHTLIGKTAFENTYGVWKSDFIENLTWEENDGSVKNPGYIKVNLKDNYDSKNFTVTIEDGAQVSPVTYTAIPTDITITRLDATENPTPGTTVAEKLKMYHGVEANITLNATSEIEAFKTIKANRWYSLVLPFNTSVREVSKAFGYAVVDIMDENSSNTTDIDFRLYLGDLEANKPFIFKVDQDIDLTSTPVTFSDKEIVYSDEPVASTADGKVKFIGVYDGKKGFSGHEYIFSLGSGNISGTKSTSYVVPMGAYIHMEEQMDGMSNAPEFHIEEPDGMTTTIKAIDFAKEGSAASSEGWYNLNGVQLESAPNQKGVYIQNGKKIVIK